MRVKECYLSQCTGQCRNPEKGILLSERLLFSEHLPNPKELSKRVSSAFLNPGLHKSKRTPVRQNSPQIPLFPGSE